MVVVLVDSAQCMIMTDPLVPRQQMPQIDEKDIPKLLVFLGKMGVGFDAGETLPVAFSAHQSIDMQRAKSMPDSVLEKPVLCTRVFELIDGNHRWGRHESDGTFVPYIRLHCSFVEALNFLAAFPFAYELTPQTPERN